MITSIILALYFIGIISLDSAVKFLYLAGGLLILAEFGVVSLGILALNGLLAIYAAFSLSQGETAFFGLPMDWGVFFGIALIEFLMLSSSIYVWKKLAAQKTDTGMEGMIGKPVTVITWDGKKGLVSYEGEQWKASSEKNMDLKEGDKISISAVHNMTIKVNT